MLLRGRSRNLKRGGQNFLQRGGGGGGGGGGSNHLPGSNLLQNLLQKKKGGGGGQTPWTPLPPPGFSLAACCFTKRCVSISAIIGSG